MSNWSFKDNLTIDNNKYLKWIGSDNSLNNIIGLSTNVYINSASSSNIMINSNQTNSNTFININNTGSTLIGSRLGVGISNTSANITNTFVLADNSYISSLSTNGYLGLTTNVGGASIILNGYSGSSSGNLNFHAGNSNGNISLYTGNNKLNIQLLNNGTVNILPDGTTIRQSITDQFTTITNPLIISNTSESFSSTTGALQIAGGIGIEGNAHINGTLSINNVSGNINFNNSTPSTSYSTGSIYFSGGLGLETTVGAVSITSGGAISAAGGLALGKNIMAGGSIITFDTSSSTNALSGSGVFYGGVGINGQVNIRSDSYSQIKLIPITTNNETSVFFCNTNNYTTSGSWSIGQNINSIGSDIFSFYNFNSNSAYITLNNNTSQINLNYITNITNQLTIKNTSNNWNIINNGNSFQLVNNTNSYIGFDINYTTGNIRLYGTVNSTSSTYGGSLTIPGGLSVSKDAYIGGNVYINSTSTINELIMLSTTDSNNLTTGSIITPGGISIGKSLLVNNMVSTTNLIATNVTLGGLSLITSTINNLVTTNISNTNIITTLQINSSIGNIYGNLSVQGGLTLGNVFISTNGNIGINNTSPGFSLDILGNVNINGGITSTNVSSINITSSNNLLQNIISTNISNTNLIGTNTIVTNITNTNLLNTTLSSGTLNATNVIILNTTITNLSNVNATISNINTTNINTTNINTIDFTSTNIITTNISNTNLNTTNITSSSINVINTITSHGSFVNITSINLITTVISSSNLLSINNTFTNITCSNLNVTNITNTNISNTNATIGTLNSTNINNTFLTTTNILNTNSTIISLIASNISSGSIYISNTSLAIGLGSGGSLNVLGGASISKNVFIGTQLSIKNTNPQQILEVSPVSYIANQDGGIRISTYDSISTTDNSYRYIDLRLISDGTNYFKGSLIGTLSGGTDTEQEYISFTQIGTFDINNKITTHFKNTTVSSNSSTGSIISYGGLSIFNTSLATSTTFGGCLTILGGAAIQQLIAGSITSTTSNLFNISNANLISTNISNTNLLSTNISISNSRITNSTITNLFTSTFTSGSALFNDSTESVNSTTGSIILKGGLSIDAGYNSSSIDNGGSLTVKGGVAVSQDLFIGGTINCLGTDSNSFAYITVTATDGAINLTTGSLVTFGGITIQSTINSESVTNGGSLLTPGGASIGQDLYVGGNIIGSGSITSMSDIKTKNITDRVENVLEKINNIRTIKYTNKSDVFSEKKYIGFISNDFIDDFPELLQKNTETGLYSLDYSRVTVVLMQCIKELKEKVHVLETIIKSNKQ